MSDTINVTELKLNTLDLSLVVDMAAKLSTSLNYIDNTPENDRHKNHMALIRLIEQVEKAENNGIPLFVGVI